MEGLLLTYFFIIFNTKDLGIIMDIQNKAFKRTLVNK